MNPLHVFNTYLTIRFYFVIRSAIALVLKEYREKYQEVGVIAHWEMQKVSLEKCLRKR